MTNDLYVTEDTTVEELVEYMTDVIENPYTEDTHDGRKVVWNFSTHEINPDDMNLEAKECDEFIVPFGVTTTWGMMFALLPQRLRNAENLVWNTREQEYHAYNQFYSKMEESEVEMTQARFAQKLALVDE